MLMIYFLNNFRDVLGAEVSDAVDLPEHGVTTVFVNLGNTKIELLHPFGNKSPIQVNFPFLVFSNVLDV
jgi:hypothetical protein